MRYDLDAVKAAAAGRWGDLLVSIGGFPPDLLTGQHYPCPKCGGTDRFNAMKDVAQTGGVRCNQCFARKNGDGFAAIQWFTGRPFGEVLASIAEAVGVKPTGVVNRNAPDRHLVFEDWVEMTAKLWCLKKPGIRHESLELVGARLAKYRKRHRVIALPVWGSHPGGGNQNGNPVGWTLYEASGHKLPILDKTGTVTGEVKIKTTAGSKPGWMGYIPAECHLIVKTEGPSDMLAVLSIAPPGVGVVCNASGAKEDPRKNSWLQAVFAGRPAWVIHDADQPGQEGAIAVGDRPGWATEIANYATECRNIVLPYAIEPAHGKDVRDWIANGGTWAGLLELAERSDKIEPPPEVERQAIEADDDPHRLARVNLKRYAMYHQDATLRFWRAEWYTWRKERGYYRKISVEELRAKIAASIKEEFNRLNVEQQETATKEVESARKVTTGLVTNVLNATASISLISESVEPNTWIGSKQNGRRFVGVQNGILDLEALLAGEKDHLFAHNPNWFTLTCRSFKYDPEARCPIWKRTIEQNMEGDLQRIAILQEWAGYCLTPDTSLQKFLVLEGEGANGKSVYMAGLEAMLGGESVSHVPLEVFGDRFSRTQTLGKLLNIAADCGELDRVAEGYVKSFTSGDKMFFDRKGLPAISCLPTARLMLGTNNRPRFSDKSSGIWRRMLLVPFLREVPEVERIYGMDKAEYWEQNGELPGIFNWAIAGLYRLREQGRFSQSVICADAMEDYRSESNPARDFLQANYECSPMGTIPSKTIYKHYVSWCQDNGHRPMSNRSFGKEIFRTFPIVDRKKFGSRSERTYEYCGLAEKRNATEF